MLRFSSYLRWPKGTNQFTGILRCFGAGNWKESKKKESSLLVKAHMPTKFLLTNKNHPAIKNACDTGDYNSILWYPHVFCRIMIPPLVEHTNQPGFKKGWIPDLVYISVTPGRTSRSIAPFCHMSWTFMGVLYLVGDLIQPIWKNRRVCQIGSWNPRDRGRKKQIFELPPPRYDWL